MKPRARKTLEERLWAKVNKQGPVVSPDLGPCWDFTGAINKVHGYGQIWKGPTQSDPMLRAHRVTYELLVGPIPDGLTLDHLCNRRQCVNPAHLDPCTIGENSHRAKERRATCRRGHPREGNVYAAPDGAERCRACNTIIARERRERLAAMR